jgi:hypothetical protein
MCFQRYYFYTHCLLLPSGQPSHGYIGPLTSDSCQRYVDYIRTRSEARAIHQNWKLEHTEPFVCCVGDNIITTQEYDDRYPCPGCVGLQSEGENGSSGSGDMEGGMEMDEPLWFWEPAM